MKNSNQFGGGLPPRSLADYVDVPAKESAIEMVGRDGSTKWTKTNSSEGLKITGFRRPCVQRTLVARTTAIRCVLQCPNIKRYSSRIVTRGGEVRGICNCGADYLYPGYGSQPPIRSHGSAIFTYGRAYCTSCVTRHVTQSYGTTRVSVAAAAATCGYQLLQRGERG